MSLQVRSLTARIGSEVKADAQKLLGGAYAGEIRSLLEERGVLVFPGLHFEDEQQIEFAQTLGQPEGSHLQKGQIMKVTFDPKENPVHPEYYDVTFSWHIDRTDCDVPPFATILTPRVLSPFGGETEFANTYAAYEDLPDSDKRLVENLEVIYSVEFLFREAAPNPSQRQLQEWREYPPKKHPLVWHHRSGRKSLLTSIAAGRVVGMDQEESDLLLSRLMAWAAQPQFIYRHHWQMGDLVMWDNTGVMHRVTKYDRNSGRRMHRVALKGEEPIRAVAAAAV